MSQRTTVSLFYRDVRSDKVYHATLTTHTNGTSDVLFQWGRRGNTLQSQSSQGLRPGEAQRLFDSKIDSKLAKGYQHMESSPVARASIPAPAVPAFGSALRRNRNPGTENGPIYAIPPPQLLNEIDRDTLDQLIEDDDYYMEIKENGWRIELRRDGQRVEGFTRTGNIIAVPTTIAQIALQTRSLHWTIDGEIVGDTVHVFDALWSNFTAVTHWSYVDRLTVVQRLFPLVAYNDPEGKRRPGILGVDTARTTGSKRNMLSYAEMNGLEGVVLRDSRAPYTSGRPNSGGTALKYKFYKTASVIVAPLIHARRSVPVQMFDGTQLGNVTIPPNHHVPIPGQVVEVRYLTINRGGSFQQPVYLGPRRDIPAQECTLDQLQFSGEGPVMAVEEAPTRIIRMPGDTPRRNR